MGRVNINVTELSQTVNITIQESATTSTDVASVIDDFVQGGSIDLLAGTRTIPLKKSLMNANYDVKCDGYINGEIAKINIIVVSRSGSSFVVSVPEDCTVIWSITKY